jgi:hypothetical protein
VLGRNLPMVWCKIATVACGPTQRSRREEHRRPIDRRPEHLKAVQKLGHASIHITGGIGGRTGFGECMTHDVPADAVLL